MLYQYFKRLFVNIGVLVANSLTIFIQFFCVKENPYKLNYIIVSIFYKQDNWSGFIKCRTYFVHLTLKGSFYFPLVCTGFNRPNAVFRWNIVIFSFSCWVTVLNISAKFVKELDIIQKLSIRVSETPPDKLCNRSLQLQNEIRNQQAT